MNINSLNVTVTGSDEKGREVVSNIITNALTGNGFTNVALVSTIGEPIPGSDVPSALEVIRSYDANFLATPVRVVGIPLESENETGDTLLTNIAPGFVAAAGFIDDESDNGFISNIVLTHKK